MRPLRTIAALAVLAFASACAEQDPGEPPPTNAFFWPVSLAVIEPPGERGTLYVVNSNFDLRFNRGTVVAVDLNQLQFDDNPGTFEAFAPPINAERGFVYIDSFGGQLAAYTPAGATPAQRRLFVPTRFDNRLYPVAADGTALSCFESTQGSLGPQDCLRQGIQLRESDKVRAEDPFAAAVLGDKVFVTHLRPADQPPGTGENGPSFLVEVDANAPRTLTFHDLKDASGRNTPTQAIAAAPAIAGASEALYFTGRPPFVNDPAQLLRAFIAGQTKTDLGLSEQLQVSEARGLAVSSDGKRLFVATRNPDGLLVLDIATEATRAKPIALDFVSLPKGASAMAVIARASLGPAVRDLVAISCTESDLLAIYDDQLGQVSTLVEGIQEPFGIAAGSRPGGAGARLYVASFGAEAVGVVDLLDLARPGGAELIGVLKAPEETP